MACEKAGTASFLGYPVTPLFIAKVTASYFVKTCDELPSHKKLVFIWLLAMKCRVSNKPLALNIHMDNVENQYIIRLCTGSDIGPLTVLYQYQYW